MKLLTNTLRQRFQEIGRQDNTTDPIVIMELFNPCGAGTWYITEFYPEEECFYAYVTGLGYDEWGYTSLKEMKALKLPFGLSIERDICFQEQQFSTIQEIHN